MVRVFALEAKDSGSIPLSLTILCRMQIVWTREDDKKASRQYYDRNIDAVKKRTKAAKKEALGLVASIKASNPCLDCGLIHHFFQMDFDHVRGKKRLSLGAAVQKGWAEDTLWIEIFKCDLVCANCHRGRTWKSLMKRSWPTKRFGSF